MIKFTIPLPPISKKNSQRILKNYKTGKYFIAPSKQYEEYEQNALWFVPKGQTINGPVNVKCLFYMPTRRLCDLTNLEEAIDDVMVKAGLLADDNYTVIQSHDGSLVLYDKDNPRTEVYIESSEELQSEISKYKEAYELLLSLSTCHTCRKQKNCEYVKWGGRVVYNCPHYAEKEE